MLKSIKETEGQTVLKSCGHMTPAMAYTPFTTLIDWR